MAETLDLIGKLIRLATNNPNEQEAQSAAVKACKLLVQHHCVITLPGAQPPKQPIRRAQQAPNWEDIIRGGPRQPWTGGHRYTGPTEEEKRRQREEEDRKEREQESKRREEAYERMREDREREKKKPRPHEWDYATMKCRRCNVTMVFFQQMGMNLPCHG